MQAIAAHPITEHWSERYGAWVVSACVHIVLFCWLVSFPGKDRLLVEPARRVRLVFATQPAAPEPAPPTPAAIPDTPPPRPVLPPEPPEETMPEPEPIPQDQATRIAEILQEYAASAEPAASSPDSSRKALRQRLDNAENALKAPAYFPDFEGARVGPYRELNYERGDPTLVSEVMERYGIEVGETFVAPGGPSFLTAASSGGRVYKPVEKAGYTEAIILPPVALRKMAWLEQNYLLTHGLDPTEARVDRVVFGIVQTTEGKWDLGILSIDIQRFSPRGTRKSPPPPDTASPE